MGVRIPHHLLPGGRAHGITVKAVDLSLVDKLREESTMASGLTRPPHSIRPPCWGWQANPHVAAMSFDV